MDILENRNMSDIAFGYGHRALIEATDGERRGTKVVQKYVYLHGRCSNPTTTSLLFICLKPCQSSER